MDNDQYFEHAGLKLKIWLNSDGYPCVTTGRGSSRQPFLLHRLVYLMTHGSIPAGAHVHHLDGDKANWQIVNLMAVMPEQHRAIHAQTRYATADQPERWEAMVMA